MVADDDSVAVFVAAHLAVGAVHDVVLDALGGAVHQLPEAGVDVDAVRHLVVGVDLEALKHRGGRRVVPKADHTRIEP